MQTSGRPRTNFMQNRANLKQTLCQPHANLMPTSDGPLGGGGGPVSIGGSGGSGSRDGWGSVGSRVKGVVGIQGSGGTQGG